MFIDTTVAMWHFKTSGEHIWGPPLHRARPLHTMLQTAGCARREMGGQQKPPVLEGSPSLQDAPGTGRGRCLSLGNGSMAKSRHQHDQSTSSGTADPSAARPARPAAVSHRQRGQNSAPPTKAQPGTGEARCPRVWKAPLRPREWLLATVETQPHHSR